MSSLQRSSINMFASMAGYVVPMLVNLIATPLLLKELGDDAFGLQSMVAVVIGYLAVMDLGLSWPIIKYLAEDHAKNDIESENRILSTTLQLYVVIGIVGMFIIIFSADLFARVIFKIPDEMIPQAIVVFRLAGIGFLGTVCTSWGQALAMGLQRFDISYGVSATSNLISIGIGLGLVYSGYGVVCYVMVRVIVSLISGPTYWLLIRRFLPKFKLQWGIDRETLRRVRGYVGYGAINRGVSSLVTKLDQTLIGIWFGIAAAGVYSVPFLVVNALGYMISYMLGFIFPMASELQSLGQMDRLRDIFMLASQFIAALAGMIFIPLFILGDIFLTLWVPTIADQVIEVLKLLTLAGYIGVLTATLPNNLMIGLGKIKQFTIYSSIRAFVLSIFCLIFISQMGIEGAGWAVLLTCSVDVIYFIIFLRRYIKIPLYFLLRRAYLKPILLGVVFAFITYLCRPYVISWISLGLVAISLSMIYITLGFCIRVFGESEKKVIRGIYYSIKNNFVNESE
ncbi:MAG: oligosaccharide flippase family protein [Desulfobacterales bacterium]|nr:oligosaccharide flippase family protein [Desulfobacterales bacterium]